MRVTSLAVASCAYAVTVSALQQSAVSSSVYSAIQRYTQFASAAYSEDCPSIPFGAALTSSVNSTSVDSKAFIFLDSSANEVIVAFRGSAFPANLDADFEFALQPLNISGTSCSSCHVHAGFQSVWNVQAANVISAVQAAMAANNGASLTVTGHSLGAALATLASANFAAEGLTPTLFTFGEPRSGDPAWASYVDSQVPASSHYRVTYANDGVPQIPPIILGYQHSGTEYWESGSTQASTFNCGTGEVTNCNAAQNYGSNPINGAHIQYPGKFLASVLYNPACGYVEP